MATADVNSEEKLHHEFEKWLTETGSECIYLLESLSNDDGVHLKMLLASEYEFELHYKKDQTSGQEIFCKASVTLSSLKTWAQSLNEFCARNSDLSFRDILTKAAELYKSSQDNGSGNEVSMEDSDDDKDEDSFKAQMSSEDDEGIFTTEWELQIACRKKRWLTKENQIRERLKKAKITNNSHTPVTDKTDEKQDSNDHISDLLKRHNVDPDTVFTGGGSSGVLTNDLITIMEQDTSVGYCAEPVEDNIYCWTVKFFNFGECELQKELRKLNEKFGYSYIELQLDFTMDLYPFYPPMVKVIRPRLKDSLMQRVSHLEIVKLSNWNPAKPIKALFEEIKRCLQMWVRLDVDSERNDRVKYKNGSYGNMDHYLLNLAFTSEINPRSNDKYLLPIDEYNTFGLSSQKTKKLKEPKKKNEFWAAGVGFGHSRRPAWDMKAYLAAQKEKDKKIEATLMDILGELRHLYSKHSPQLKPPCQGGEAAGIVERKKALPNHVEAMDVVMDGKGEGSRDLHNAQAENQQDGVADIFDAIDTVYQVIEGSALIPFFEQYLKVDSFLEICRHTAVYKVIIDILRELALQNQLIPLLGLLPRQEKSIFEFLEVLAAKADKLLQHICKAGNGHVPKAAEAEDEEPKQSGGWFANRKKNWFTKSKDTTPAAQASPLNPSTSQPQQSTSQPKPPEATATSSENPETAVTSEEKLAREFLVLFQDVTEGFNRAKIDPRTPPPKVETDDKPAICKCVLTGINEDAILEETYKKALSPLLHDSCEFALSGASAHHYSKDFQKQTTLTQSQVFRVAQEVSSLFTSLPLFLRSSICIRTDDEKLTLLKALITGPEGTPYSGGCFVFDIFFPSTYPRNPPKVFLCTTGHNSVRFNPNLYSCGKVCLSLLGTWEGQSGEQWHETTSTLLQVLVSIQSLILVPDPYFNEPGYEREIGTETGNKHSAEYNAEVRINNIKHAILAQLSHPCPEFEDVIRMHFHVKQDRIMEEILAWQVPKQRKLDKLIQQLRDGFKRNSAIVTRSGTSSDFSQAGSSGSSCSENNEKLSVPSSKSSDSPNTTPKEPQPSTSQASPLSSADSLKPNNHSEEEPMDDNESSSLGDDICAKCGGVRIPPGTGSETVTNSMPSTSSSGVATASTSAEPAPKVQKNTADLSKALNSWPGGDLLSSGHTVSEEDYPSEEEEDKVPPSALCFGL